MVFLYRSEGEKVRVGDDLILVSVATERYLVSTRFISPVATIRLRFGIAMEIFLFTI